MHTGFWQRILGGGDHLDDLGVDWSIMLGSERGTWIGLIWLRKGRDGGIL